MAFIPMPYRVEVTRDGGDATGEYDAHGNPIIAPPSTFWVSAAGWSEPGDEALANAQQALGVDLALELLADAGTIKLGDIVTIDGGKYTAVTRANYDYGPFGFTPGLDVIRLTARKG